LEPEIPSKPKHVRKAEFEQLHAEFIEKAKQRAKSQALQALNKIVFAKEVTLQTYRGLKETREAGERIYAQKRLNKHPPNRSMYLWTIEHDAEHPGGVLMIANSPIRPVEYVPIDAKKLRDYVNELRSSDQRQVIKEEPQEETEEEPL